LNEFGEFALRKLAACKDGLNNSIFDLMKKEEQILHLEKEKNELKQFKAKFDEMVSFKF
jgi:hypothetical protein